MSTVSVSGLNSSGERQQLVSKSPISMNRNPQLTVDGKYHTFRQYNMVLDSLAGSYSSDVLYSVCLQSQSQKAKFCLKTF